MSAMHSWPPELPAMPWTYSEMLPNLRQEFVPDVGPVKRRGRLSSAGEVEVQAGYKMAGYQVNVLREFYMTTTKNGTESVAMPHFLKGKDTGSDVGEESEMFIDSVEIQHEAADLWDVAVTFRVVTS